MEAPAGGSGPGGREARRRRRVGGARSEEQGARGEARPGRQPHHVTLWAGFGASPRVAAHVRAAGQGEGERGSVGACSPAAGRVSPRREDGAGRPGGSCLLPKETWERRPEGGGGASLLPQKSEVRAFTLGPRGASGWKSEGGCGVRVGQGGLNTSKVGLRGRLLATTLF